MFFSLWCENDSRLQKDLKKQPSRSPQLAHMYVIVITENYFFLVNNKILFGTRNTSLVRVSIELLQEDDGGKWTLKFTSRKCPQ